MQSLLSGACALVLSAACAQASTIDTFDVDLDNAAGTDSSVSLSSGVIYEITVSGVGTYAGGGRLVDPAYGTDFSQPGQTSLSDPSTRGPIFGPTFGLGTLIDEVEIDFGAYRSDNTYTTSITGTGSTINVRFLDTSYGDNTGFFTVSIVDNRTAAIPLPAGGALLLTAIGGVAALRRKRRT